jgi:hypothetical protein
MMQPDQVMLDTFSIDLYGALEIADSLFTEQSAASGESKPRHSEVLRDALQPVEMLRQDAVEPVGLAFRTCLRIRGVLQQHVD